MSRPLEAAAVDSKGNVYGNLGGDVVRINAETRQVTAQWPTGCNDASGLATDSEGQRIFQACDGKKMAVADMETGKVLATAEIGDRPDGAAWSAKYHLAFATTNDGLLSVIDANAPGYPTIEKLTTQLGARTIAYDPDTDRIYTVSADRSPNAPSGPPQGMQGPPQGQGPGGPRGPSPYVADTFAVIVIGR